jgi:hypothetical protein
MGDFQHLGRRSEPKPRGGDHRGRCNCSSEHVTSIYGHVCSPFAAAALTPRGRFYSRCQQLYRTETDIAAMLDGRTELTERTFERHKT